MSLGLFFKSKGGGIISSMNKKTVAKENSDIKFIYVRLVTVPMVFVLGTATFFYLLSLQKSEGWTSFTDALLSIGVALFGTLAIIIVAGIYSLIRLINHKELRGKWQYYVFSVIIPALIVIYLIVGR